MEGVLVQQMVQNGVELMIGVAPDPLFGPLIAFGLGRIHVEILVDVRFRVTPLSDQDAREMVREIRGIVCCRAIAATLRPTLKPLRKFCFAFRGWSKIFHV